MPLQYIALRHIGHGSQEVYMTQSESLKVSSLRQAALIADTSAWAVGSLLAVTLLAPVAMTSPSLTITAPKGPPPFLTFSTEISIAICIKCLSCSVIFIVSKSLRDSTPTLSSTMTVTVLYFACRQRAARLCFSCCFFCKDNANRVQSSLLQLLRCSLSSAKITYYGEYWQENC